MAGNWVWEWRKAPFHFLKLPKLNWLSGKREDFHKITPCNQIALGTSRSSTFIFFYTLNFHPVADFAQKTHVPFLPYAFTHCDRVHLQSPCALISLIQVLYRTKMTPQHLVSASQFISVLLSTSQCHHIRPELSSDLQTAAQLWCWATACEHILWSELTTLLLYLTILTLAFILFLSLIIFSIKKCDILLILFHGGILRLRKIEIPTLQSCNIAFNCAARSDTVDQTNPIPKILGLCIKC